MKITFNGTEYTEITAIIDGQRLPGIMIHDEADTNRDGDAICTNCVSLPEDAEQAAGMLQNEFWDSDFSVMGTVEIA